MLLSFFKYFEKSLKLYIELNDKQGIAISFENFGRYYVNKGLNEKAKESFNKALDIYDQINDKQGKGISLNIIGEIYFERGDFIIAKKHFDDALM